MKNLLKLTGIIALVAVMTFAMASCNNGTTSRSGGGSTGKGGGGSGGDGGKNTNQTFTSIAAFKAWLDAQEGNTAETAYKVKLNVSDIGGVYANNGIDRFPSGSVGNALNTNFYKYINLDLSGSNLTSIGDFAFAQISNLTAITIPSSATSIGSNAFWGCTGLTSITIPNSVTSIGNAAFSDCKSLTSVTIPNSVTSIGQDAFVWCYSLDNITIPSSVTSIGIYVFSRCINLKNINVDNNNPNYSSYMGILYNKDKTTLLEAPAGISGSVNIPSSVKVIFDYAFGWCTGLATVTIPEGVTSIGFNAFFYCTGLTYVAIPSSVTKISDYAFSDCRLTSVSFAAGSNIGNANFGDYVFPEGNVVKQNQYWRRIQRDMARHQRQRHNQPERQRHAHHRQ